MKDDVRELIEALGGISSVTEYLGIVPSSPYQWCDRIPARYYLALREMGRRRRVLVPKSAFGFVERGGGGRDPGEKPVISVKRRKRKVRADG